MHLSIPALALLLGANPMIAGTPLIKSTDGGRTWLDIDPGPAHQGIIQLQISGSRLYALTVTRTEAPPFDQLGDFSVLSSSDGGQTWRTLDLLGVTRGFAAMAVASSDPETLYVTRGGLGRTITDGATITLARSTDGGATVNEIESAEEALRPFNTYPAWCSPKPVFLGVHPALAATLFMAFDCSGDSMDPFHAFILSRDGGLNWFANSSLGWLNTLRGGGARKPDLAVTRLLADPREPSLVYAVNRGSDGKFHFAKSSDEGDSWSTPLLRNVASAALHPRDPAVLLASKHDGSLWKSNDRAETWQHLGNWLPFDRIVIHPAKDAVILAQAPAVLHQGINTGEIFKSQDGGATWSVIPTGMDGFSFVFDPANPDIIYGISERRVGVRLRPPYLRNLAGGSTLAPASLFAVYGEDLAGQVTFNGITADLLFASRRQINGRVPIGLKPGEVVVEVLREPAGAPAIVDRQPINLSFSPAPVILHDSAGRPNLYHQENGRRITDVDPAFPGELIVLYCTGLGEAQASAFVQFWPMEQPSAVQRALFAEPVADQPGVFRVGIEVPATLRPGSHLLLFWGGRNFARLEVR
jgi:uncharacterized protein (TIGR03437 family)